MFFCIENSLGEQQITIKPTDDELELQDFRAERDLRDDRARLSRAPHEAADPGWEAAPQRPAAVQPLRPGPSDRLEWT